MFSTLSKATGQQIGFVKSETKSTEQLIAELSADPRVQLVEPNYLRHASSIVPNDPYFSKQWGLLNSGSTGVTAGADISATDAWAIRTSAPGKVVAVLDTGVNASHPDLAANMWRDAAGKCGYDFVNNDDDPEDDEGHGTHVAGIIGAVGNNSVGVSGVAWDVKIMAVKVLNGLGSGSTAAAIRGLDWIVSKKKEGIDIVAVNASLGGGPYSEIERLAVAALGNENIILVAAAGNAGTNNDFEPAYPASYSLPNIISVAATDANDNLAYFSNYGKTTVDLAAPGVGILSTGILRTPKQGDLFFDDMESGDGKWVISADTGSVNAWSIVDLGQKCFQANAFIAQNNVSYLAVRESIDLSGTAGKPLMLGAMVQMAFVRDSDELRLQFSKDGGITWQEALSVSYYKNNDLKEWIPFSQSIPPAYRTASFRFRFVFLTGAKVDPELPGILLDDIRIGESTSSYISMPGTSMAAPFVTGAVALAAARFPGQSPIARVLENVDPLPSLQDKVATGGRLNLYKTLYEYEEPKGDVEGCNGLGFSPYFFLLALPLAALLKKK